MILPADFRKPQTLVKAEGTRIGWAFIDFANEGSVTSVVYFKQRAIKKFADFPPASSLGDANPVGIGKALSALAEPAVIPAVVAFAVNKTQQKSARLAVDFRDQANAGCIDQVIELMKCQLVNRRHGGVVECEQCFEITDFSRSDEWIFWMSHVSGLCVER